MIAEERKKNLVKKIEDKRQKRFMRSEVLARDVNLRK